MNVTDFLNVSSIIVTTLPWRNTSESANNNVTTEALNLTGSGDTTFWLPNYWSGFVERPTSQQSTSFGVWIRLVGLPPVLVLGVVGNILAVCVMCRPNMRRHSFSYYLVLLGICDTVSLIVRLLFWVNLFQEFQSMPVLITFTNLPVCIISEYIITANTIICSWVVVCLTYERVIIVLFPLTGTKWCKPSTSRKVLVVLVVFPFVLLSYIPFNTNYRTGIGCAMRYIPDMMVHYIIATTFVTMLPLALIFLGNSAIIIQLRRQNKEISGSGNREDKRSRVTTMLVTVSLTFFILVFPNATFALVLTLRPDWGALRVAIDPAAFLWDVNFAINFYLYVITGNNVRAEVRQMFSCMTSRKGTGVKDAVGQIMSQNKR